MAEEKKSNKMWGGRFEESPTSAMQKINMSLDVDKRLWRQDIRASTIHCEMLMQQGIISETDGQAIIGGLSQIQKDIEEARFVFKPELEDIHMNIENALSDLIGDAAGRLHTARSRNDQVVTDFRLWLRDAIDVVIQKIEIFEDTLDSLIAIHKDTVMPGFTHLQAAQPVSLSLHLDAYLQMMERDKSRFIDCARRLNESPLGAAALAGTPFPIDREYTAAKLGFMRPMPNTMDAVSARDFATEFLFCAAQCGIHLSRLAEEIIFWSSQQFNFVRLADSWSTGSSIMPQKKNPDAAELIRGKTGRLNGNLVQMLTVLKGLPLAYNKDLQEDKEAVFDSYDTICLCLEAMEGMLSTAQFNTDKMKKDAEAGFTTATALADWLVMHLNIPFRQAHHITGAIVKEAEERNCSLAELPLEAFQRHEPNITEEIYTVLRI
ncbi:MAG: argininosuccinate lyase [Alphaproteobacteria bacterium]|nr:argininosuccinate lyase [Alphaproteobacteria bacterium]MCD8570196.1 argininosuccinate lyase [Alphaproteobacteria bacterium]